MQGARAEGDIRITANTLNAAKQIVSVSGTRTLNVVNQNLNDGVAISTVARLPDPDVASPVATPGPTPAIPAAPLIPGALPPSAPSLPEILVGSPTGVDVSSISAPGGGGSSDDDSSETLAANNNASSGELIEVFSDSNEEEEQASEASERIAEEEQLISGPNPTRVFSEDGEGFVVFTGGRGVAQIADLGRSGSSQGEQNIFAGDDKEGSSEGCGGGSGGYFGVDAFGGSRAAICTQ